MIFSTILILCAILGLLIPDIGIHFGFLLLPILFVLMFFSSLKVDLGMIKNHLQKPLILFLSVFMSYIVIPLVMYLLAKSLHVDEQLIISTVVSALAPTIVSAMYFTKIVQGDVNLAFIITVLISLLAPILIPLELYIFFAMSTKMPYAHIINNILLLVLAPVVLVYIFRKKMSHCFHLILRYENQITSTLFAAFIYIACSLNSEYFLSLHLGVMYNVLLIAFVQGIIIFYVILFVGKKLVSSYIAKAFAISVSIKNTMLTSALMLTVSQDLSLISNVVIIIHIFVFSLLVVKKEKILN